jgi:hypothetical protein
MSERVYSGVTLENLTALVDRLQGGKECGNSTDPCNSMTTANAHRLGGNTSKANTTANERARAEGPRPLVENLVRRLEDRLTIRAITNCPLCDQMCPMVFPCTECDFLGCGNCYDDHKHSSDSDVSAERYRDQRPKDAATVSWDEEQPEESPLPAGVIRFNRNHRVRKPEPKPKAVNIGCAKCDPFPCTCLPPAAKEVQ